MTKLISRVVLTMLIGAVPNLAHAQTATTQLTGTWQAEADGRQAWRMIFRMDGSHLVGTVSSCGADPGGFEAAQVYDVNLTGDTLRFKCTSGSDGRVISFEGRHKDDEIELTYQQRPRNGAAPDSLTPDSAGWFGPSAVPRFVATRVKEAGDEFAAAINLPLKNVKVEGELFMPPRVERIRSVLVLVNSGTGWEGMAASLYRDPAMRALSAEIASSLLLLRISNVGQTAFLNVIANAAAGADESLLKLLDRVALETGHPELRSAPVVVWGHSRASNFAATFAALHPERTIAIVRYHSGDQTLAANMGVLSRVPALLLCAGKDQIIGQPATEAAEKTWKDARASGAPWTFAVEPDATHQNPADLKTADALLVPWLRAVIGRRVSSRGGALQPITEGNIWMGDSWLPDEASALGWQKVIGLAAPIAAAQSPSTDPITGAWGENGVPMLELRLDSANAVSGQTHWRSSRDQDIEAPIAKGSFDAKARTFRIEGETKNPDGADAHYVIDGKLVDGETVTVTFNVGGRSGALTFRKLGAQK